MKIISPLKAWLWEIKGERLLNIKTNGRDASDPDKDHHPYEPTPYCVLERLAASGHLKEADTLVDYGCGKGRASLFLSNRTGCRSIGVECGRGFLLEALENKERTGGGRQVDFVLEHAERYEVPPEANRFYFFNPFSTGTLREVMRQIRKSYAAAPRAMLLFFYYPSKKYMEYLEEAECLMLIEDIDCRDLFFGRDERERVLVYEFAADKT